MQTAEQQSGRDSLIHAENDVFTAAEIERAATFVFMQTPARRSRIQILLKMLSLFKEKVGEL